jgi:alpha-glucosidase
MQWDRSGGFTRPGVRPWLPMVDPEQRNVADQRDDPGSLLNDYRRLIARRPRVD